MPGEQFKTLCLYYFPIGPPSRHVMLAAKVLGIEPTMKHTDLLKGEHLKREFLQINPEHKVPTLTDNGFALGESRAIMTYLADKYGKNESLYPKNLTKRAKVNQMLYFDAQNILGALISYYSPVFFGAKTCDESKKQDVEKGIKMLDTFLKESPFVAGEKMTLADIALVSSVATAVYTIDFGLRPYEHVQKWFQELEKSLPDFKEIIEDNCKQLKEVIDMMKKKNNA